MFDMGTITVNISDETENFFRDAVKKKLGVGKGKLGFAIDNAMKNWISEQEQKEAVSNLMKHLDKGFNLGKILYKKRDELYER